MARYQIDVQEVKQDNGPGCGTYIAILLILLFMAKMCGS